MKTRYGNIVLLLALVLSVSVGLTALFGRYPTAQNEEELSVVAAFYPLYTAALQVVGEVDGVSVSCLTSPGSGCLHEYQLSPAERTRLGRADVLILNGGGMESFLDSVWPSLSDLVTVNTTANVPLLCGEDVHSHEHGHDHAVNAHAWIDPSRYAQQVQAVCDGLCEKDPSRADIYQENTAAYIEKIEEIGTQLKALSLPLDGALLFHDSMAYVAESLSLRTVGRLPIGEQEAASAADLAAVAQTLRGQAVLFLYDAQYPLQHVSLMSYAEKAVPVRWDTAVMPQNGVADKEAWLHAMQNNIQLLREVLS